MTGVIIFHKNIYQIYREDWVKKSLDSIRNQAHNDFRVFELCYGDTPERLYEGSEYIHKPLENHIMAMNFLIDVAFADGCETVFITNLDDINNHNRTAVQLRAVEQGYDLVSSNFTHIDEEDKILRDMLFHNRNIHVEFAAGNNIIAHPAVAITKNFWTKYKYYNTNELGYEDFSLWKKAAADNCKIFITPEILLYHRIHSNQTGRIHSPTLKQST